jgi:hypothetical protein
MLEINEILKKYQLKPKKYTKKEKILIIDTEQGKYTIKKRKKNNEYIYDYLKTRNFNYIPKILNEKEDQYEIRNYVESYEIPDEQKILDLIDLVSLLHNKTTHYKEATEDDYKEIYEDIKNNINYLESYYNDMITIIESKVYMSPCEYLIARNISKIFEILNFINKESDNWYQLVQNNKKQRMVVLHNNLELNHFISNEKNYLISWEKSKIGIPIFDIYKLYKKHGLEYDFSEILKRYEKNYPLHEDERKLLFILMLLPDKIELEKTEYENTKEAGKIIDMMYKTEILISPYYSDKRPKNNKHE